MKAYSCPHCQAEVRPGQIDPSQSHAFRSIGLELGPDIVDLANLIIADDPHPGALVVAGLDQPDGFELAHRLADGRLAGVELGGDSELDQPIPGAKGAREDLLHQMLADLGRERGTNDLGLRHERTFAGDCGPKHFRLER